MKTQLDGKLFYIFFCYMIYKVHMAVIFTVDLQLKVCEYVWAGLNAQERRAGHKFWIITIVNISYKALDLTLHCLYTVDNMWIINK